MAATLARIDTANGRYVIAEGTGYSCVGFEYLMERYNRLARELDWRPFPIEEYGTAEGFERYEALMAAAEATGRRFSAELSPQLVGKERLRVEVIDRFGERRRFYVGKSTGWLPCHLEIKTSRSHGGPAADREYREVRVIDPPRRRH